MTFKRILTYLGVGVLLGLILIATEALNLNPTSSIKYEVVESIKYEVVDQSFPGDGLIRAITVDPAQRTEAGLLALADQLKRETKDTNGLVLIFIYDDLRAAALRRDALRGDKLNERAQKLHDDHKIGNYTRNPNTGHHSIMIALDGVSEAAKTKTIPLQ
jgi:hypothetical protein